MHLFGFLWGLRKRARSTTRVQRLLPRLYTWTHLYTHALWGELYGGREQRKRRRRVKPLDLIAHQKPVKSSLDLNWAKIEKSDRFHFVWQRRQPLALCPFFLLSLFPLHLSFSLFSVCRFSTWRGWKVLLPLIKFAVVLFLTCRQFASTLKMPSSVLSCSWSACYSNLIFIVHFGRISYRHTTRSEHLL